MALCLIVYACLVLGLVAAEFKGSQTAQSLLKPAAALGFLVIACLSGALDHHYGRIIFFGLIACAVGDIFLLSRKSQKLFLAGMVAFAIGHFAYLTAFVPFEAEGFSAGTFIRNLLAIFAVVGVGIWIHPHVPRALRLAVKAYALIILIMVINALDLPQTPPLVLAMIGAVMFAVSDIFVARDRFVSRSPYNALAITPLYFGAQALIALSTQS